MFMKGKAMCSIDKATASEVPTENQASTYIPPSNTGGYDGTEQQQ